MRFAFTWTPWLGRVHRKKDAVGIHVAFEVASDGPRVLETAAVRLGQIHSECGSDEPLSVQGDADEAFLRPETQRVSDEAEDISRRLHCECFHFPVPPTQREHRARAFDGRTF